MGVKFTREYNNIISDLTDLLININDIYILFEMPKDIWKDTNETEKRNYIETLADDIFFALGNEPEFNMDFGKIIYNAKQYTLEVFNDLINIGTINLI